MSLVLIALGALTAGVAYLWAASGSAPDANIGAGLLGLAGVAVAAVGVAWLLSTALVRTWRRARRPTAPRA